jgi:hypothetical protein
VFQDNIGTSLVFIKAVCIPTFQEVVVVTTITNTKLIFANFFSQKK